MRTYIATVKILVVAPSQADACGVVSDILNDPINAALLDWGYVPTADGKDFAYPELHTDLDRATYTEGAFVGTPLENAMP